MRRIAGLRPRIALLVAAVVAVSLIAAFAVVYRSTSSQLRERTDNGLRNDLKRFETAVQSAGGGDNADIAIDNAAAYVRSEPFRATARLLLMTTSEAEPITNQPDLIDPDEVDDGLPAPERSEARAAARRFLRAPMGFSETALPGAGKVRLYVKEAESGFEPIRLAVGTPLGPDARARDDVLDAFLAAGAIGLLVALLGGGLIASRVVAPLRRMASVAAQVDAGDLGSRMGEVARRDEIGVLARSFDHMLDRLQDAFDRQNAFVADASHELRTPLTVIRGQLEVLGMDDAPSADDVRRVERVTRTEVDRMSRLVDDLLVLARADREEFLRREPIDLPAFLEETLDGMRPTADRRFELTPVPPIVLDADPDRLAQALRNLLANAIAHTAAGGLVRLGCDDSAGRIRLTVDDDGPGIPAEQRERVLDRFHRLDQRRGRGAGLGLAIVHAIAAAHGGTLQIEDSLAGGARVVLELAPALGRPATPSHAARTAPRPG
jgi:two-component system, OmpR family, sensor kinase